MKKYAFFDLDGTLHPNACSTDFIEITERKGYSNIGYRDSFDKFLIKYNKGEYNYNDFVDFVLDSALKIFNSVPISILKEVSKEYTETIEFYPWVADTLSYLKQSNFKVVIVSAGIDILVEDISKMLNVDKSFSTEYKKNTYGNYFIPKILNSTKKKGID